MPEKNIISIVACRGASRTLAPPEQMSKGVAPFRCCIFTERGTGELRAETEWEPWENLAKRNLIRPSHATRINMTVFAKNDVPRSTASSDPNSQPDVTDVQTSGNSEMPETSRESENSPLEDKSSSNMPASPELTSSQNADLRSVGQSRRFQNLPRDEKITLLRTNKNLGHPSPERPSTLLRATRDGCIGPLSEPRLALPSSSPG